MPDITHWPIERCTHVVDICNWRTSLVKLILIP